MNKKIKAIINENLLFAFRENLLIVPIGTYLLFMGVYLFFGSDAILSEFKEVSYISLMSNIQYLLGMMIIIFLSITSFDKDFKTKNIYITLQQVTKKDYFLGKLISIFLLSGLLNLILMIIFFAGYIYEFKEINFNLAYIFIFQQLEFLVVSFIASLLSLLLTKNMGRLILILIVLVLGHTIPLFKQFLDKGIINIGELGQNITNVLFYALPNLSMLNVKDEILYNTTLGNSLLWATLYTIGLIYILYKIAIYIFNKKDF